MNDKNKELSKNDNSFKYFIKLMFIALILVGISITFLTYIISLLRRI